MGMDLKTLTTNVVTAFLSSSNSVAVSDLPGLIRSVHGALAGLEKGQVGATVDSLKPAVAIKKSVTPDAIFCLECGKDFKMIRRHITTDHGLTVDEYRAKWGLVKDYPMVASRYAARRSALAKTIGLGKSRGRKKAEE